MLTGHGSIDTAIESIRMGAFDYVVKPCPLDELEVRIQRAIERRALRQAREPAGARADAARPGGLVRRRQPGVPAGPPAREPGGAERLDRADHGRDRVGQGDRGQADSRAQPAALPPVRRRRVRGAAGEPAAERAVRPRAGRVHRRRPREAGALRGGARRHDLPRRDRRGEPGDAGEAAARAGHLHVPARRRRRRRSTWTCACSPPPTATCPRW